MRTHRLPVALLVLVAGGLLAAYFLNSPAPILEFDSQNSLGTPTYVGAAKDIASGHLLSTGRLPGYPLLVALLGGAGGFFTLIVVLQSVFFVAAVVLTYTLAFMAFRARWIAFLVSLMLATDVFAAAYAKEILSESLALLLLAGLLVAMASFTLRPRPSMLWLTAALATATTFTRAEWTFLPLALGLYLFVWAIRRPFPRPVILHGLGALAACYAVVGLYIAGNFAVNGYAGTSEINNVSVLGKVMQYDMQLEAPPQYRDQALLVDRYVNVTHLNVWHVVTENPEFATDHYALAGAFGRAIVLADPGRYLVRSLDVALTHNTDVDRPLLHLAPQGPLRLPLAALARYTEARYAFYWLLAAFTLMWALFPLLSRRKSPLDVLGPVAAMTGYGMLIIGLGGFDEYGRYHTVYLPASNLLVWGTLLLNVVLANRARASVRPSLPALVLLEIVAVVLLTAAPGFALSGVVTIVVALLQGVVMWLALTDEPLEARQLQAQPAPRTRG